MKRRKFLKLLGWLPLTALFPKAALDLTPDQVADRYYNKPYPAGPFLETWHERLRRERSVAWGETRTGRLPLDEHQ